MISNFKDKNHRTKKNYKKYELLITILDSFDTTVIFATTSSFITLSVTKSGLIAIQVSAAT